jgi:hypothetical protein
MESLPGAPPSAVESLPLSQWTLWRAWDFDAAGWRSTMMQCMRSQSAATAAAPATDDCGSPRDSVEFCKKQQHTISL